MHWHYPSHILLLGIILLSSCADLSILDSWSGSAPGGHKYKTVVVVAILKNETDRSAVEKSISRRLHRHGIVAVSGAGILHDRERPSRQALAEAVKIAGADSVITIHFIAQTGPSTEEATSRAAENFSSFYPGYWLPSVYPEWSIYSHYLSTPFHDPPQADLSGLVQANFFDVELGALVWAGKIEVLASPMAPATLDQLGNVLVQALAVEGLI